MTDKRPVNPWTVASLTLLATTLLFGNSVQAQQRGLDQPSNFSPVGKYPIVKTPITLTAFMPQPPDLVNYTTNLFTKHVEKLTGINIQWDAVPQADVQSKEQLELSSGNYPETFMDGNFTKAQQLQYGQQGVLVPLEGLIDKYAPNIKKAMQEVPALKAAMVAPNGHIYSIPSYNACFHCWYAQKYWINQAWLKTLKLPLPKTTAQFESDLIEFKKKFPNSIPLTGEGPDETDGWHTDFTAFLMNSFIYDDGTDYFYVKNGKVQFAPSQPQWKQGLEYMHQLYSKGLLDPEAFTQNAQTFQQKGSQVPERLGAFPAGDDRFILPMAEHKDFTALAPLKGPNGVQYSGYFKEVGNGAFAITNKASQEQAIAAIRLVDYLYTLDGTQGVEDGPYGVMWTKPSNGQKGLDGQPAIFQVNPRWWKDQTQNYDWDQLAPNFRPRWIYEGRYSSPNPAQPSYNEIYLYQQTVKKYQPYTPPLSMVYPMDVFVTPKDAETSAQLRSTVNNYVDTWMAQFVTGQKSLNKDWNTYIAGLNGLNLGQYLGTAQSAYNTWIKQHTNVSSILGPDSPNPPKGWSRNQLFY